MFSIGDWVKDTSGKTGFVVSVYKNNYYVRFLKNDIGVKINHSIYVSTNELKHAPVDFKPYEDELYFLINLALDTRDKIWFVDLSSRLLVLQKERLNIANDCKPFYFMM
ncbi:hypothetical protein WQ54_11440 [Bacillus sp. SA1-12]|uniref:IDEAL domain-containing protein n=1 Tax=Bacillus sp. SA1-12 TaxID=1455638 RepID=UPI00062526EC|nr:IDEAL domain-containing protein [Bacillus sp. SA1-12]KKI92047.1 hypothetical protein WQ54_11440 [Bacillus sp. SA1-12]